MARSVNKVTLIGIVGNDVQVNALSSGNSAVNLSIATDESYNDRNTGMKVEQTEWHRVTAFGKLAEIIGQYVRKGSRIYIEGRLRTREWEKDGIKRYTTEIIANEMMMLDRANPGSSPTAGAPMSSGYSGNYQQPQAPQASVQQPVQQPNIPPQGYQAPPQQPMQQPVQPMQQPNPAQNNFANNDGNFDDDIPF